MPPRFKGTTYNGVLVLIWRHTSLDRLLTQARGRHYSTFSLYRPGEFEVALVEFETSIKRAYSDIAHITWTDENMLLHIRCAA